MPKGGAKRLLGSVVAVLLGLTLVVASTGLFLPAVPTLTVSLIEPPKLVLPLGPWFRPVARRLELPEIASVPPPPYPLLHRTLPLPPGEQPMIAIVLDDVGLDHARAERATALPGPITLSFMTYAQDLSKLAAKAKAHGNEIMLHIPMQPIGRQDPGPNALSVTLNDDEIRRRLDWDLSRLGGIVGVNNHMGSRFTEWDHGMELVLSVLKSRGLFFLDSRTTPRSVGDELAGAIGVPHAQRDIFLDNDVEAPAVATMLSKVEQFAARHGSVIAIGHPHDATLDALAAWLPQVRASGYRLVPVSALISRGQTPEVDSVAAEE